MRNGERQYTARDINRAIRRRFIWSGGITTIVSVGLATAIMWITVKRQQIKTDMW